MIRIRLIFLTIILFSFQFLSGSNIVSGSSECHLRVKKILSDLYNPTDLCVLVVAHRGDWRNAPENSIQAIKNCIEMGVDIVEIDVRMTKDSVLVLMHDNTIDRTTTGTGKISDMTLTELKSVQLLNGCDRATKHRIPTLEEAMQVAKGNIMVNLDKCSNYMDKAFEVIDKTHTIEQVIFKGSKSIDQVKEKYGSILEEIIYMPVIKESTSHLRGFVDDFIFELGPVAFEVIYKSDDSPMFDVIQTIKKQECRIWVNTLWESLCGEHTDDLAVDDPDAAWGWVIDNGANIIQTDRPELLLKYLRKKGLHD
ncbi:MULTISPECIES: glycerophosphodiester phosphodiesterase family protein [unclassified Carboxylicivirga]|uniref:glycerophosphodiester phosphodiesterase family protein n=1 Tax=Carboxylicivirga TaxID=1628153 RepID=UPI003D349FD0